MIEQMAKVIREGARCTPEEAVAVAGNWWRNHDTWPTGSEMLQATRRQVDAAAANLALLTLEG